MNSPPVKEKTPGRAMNTAPGHEESNRRKPIIPPTDGKPKVLTYHERFLPRAEDAGRQLIASWIEHGPKEINHFDPSRMPTGPLVEVATGVLDAMLNHGVRDFAGLVAYFTEAPEPVRTELIECTQSFSPMPGDCGPLLSILREYDRTRRRETLAHRLSETLARADDPSAILAEIAALEAEVTGKTRSMIVHGVNSFPTVTPPETVILGNGWLRRGDIATLISTAGNGKSVAMIQASMAWGLGLPYFGIKPPHPLRILLFSGEDDGVTFGQCREGFLEHSEAITERHLTAQDLAPLDSMLRVEFCREHVGLSFHPHLAGLLREAPADLVNVNPLLSFIGGEIVACASQWLRAELMPILQKHDCACLIAHHTPKMAKDGWENTDDTYAAIGGAEIANVPRAILTLRPTSADGLCVVKVSKRQTTGWKDGNDAFATTYFVKRSGNPERPAWIPVGSDEAAELMAACGQSGSNGANRKKVTTAHVVKELATGAMKRQALIETLMRKCRCSDRPARDAITEAEADELVSSFTEPNTNGGKPTKWLCLPEHQKQWVA
jgi:hypothetical protein